MTKIAVFGAGTWGIALARLLAVLEPRCREEWRAGFPNVEERLAAEKAREQGGSPV